MQNWARQVVVITGATSGLGRATAIAFARRGSTVVLTGRRQEALHETALLCREAGGRAVTCVADITQEQDVEKLVQCALEPEARIDVWVNNAGVTLFAELDQAPFEQHRRVIETNVFGTMLCSRALLPVFRRQRRGVLINVGSVLSKVGQPFVPSYVVSKFAIRGLSETLRMHFADYPDVHVSTLLPYAMDTEHFEAGANYVGRPAHAMQPVLSPESVAEEVVALAESHERERHVPRWMPLTYVPRALFPRFSERLLRRTLSRWHFEPRLEASHSGNLYLPRTEGAVHGHRAPLASTAALAASVASDAAQLVGRDVMVKVSRLVGLTVRLSFRLTSRLLGGEASGYPRPGRAYPRAAASAPAE